VLWSLARGGPDPDFLAAAAASLARLTHTEPVRIAGACLFALVLQDTLVAEAIGSERPRTVPSRWVDLARRWGGAQPPERLADAAMDLADAAAAVPASTAPRPVIEALEVLDRL
jgi:hypothetical protein